MRPAQPKWLNKEYKPVFKMPGSSGNDSNTIQHRTSGEFLAAAAQSQHMPGNRPDIVTLSQSHNPPKFDGSLSPRSDQPSNNTAPFTNSHKQKSPELKKMLADVQAQQPQHNQAMASKSNQSHSRMQMSGGVAMKKTQSHGQQSPEQPHNVY